MQKWIQAVAVSQLVGRAGVDSFPYLIQIRDLPQVRLGHPTGAYLFKRLFLLSFICFSECREYVHGVISVELQSMSDFSDHLVTNLF